MNKGNRAAPMRWGGFSCAVVLADADYITRGSTGDKSKTYQLRLNASMEYV